MRKKCRAFFPEVGRLRGIASAYWCLTYARCPDRLLGTLAKAAPAQPLAGVKHGRRVGKNVDTALGGTLLQHVGPQPQDDELLGVAAIPGGPDDGSLAYREDPYSSYLSDGAGTAITRVHGV